MTQKWELRTVIKVEPHENFSLTCTFDNSIVKEFNLKPLLLKGGPVIQPLKKYGFFKQVFLEMGVPTWPNGFDLCADSIYREGQTVKSLLKTKKR